MMKRKFFALVVCLFTFMASSNMLAAIISDDYNPIEWKDSDGIASRSLQRIDGYVHNGFISLHLYDSPAKATVSIISESGIVVFEGAYDNPTGISIDLSSATIGSYEIRVIYGGKMYIGEFRIE